MGECREADNDESRLPLIIETFEDCKRSPAFDISLADAVEEWTGDVVARDRANSSVCKRVSWPE